MHSRGARMLHAALSKHPDVGDQIPSPSGIQRSAQYPDEQIPSSSSTAAQSVIECNDHQIPSPSGIPRSAQYPDEQIPSSSSTAAQSVIECNDHQIPSPSGIPRSAQYPDEQIPSCSSTAAQSVIECNDHQIPSTSGIQRLPQWLTSNLPSDSELDFDSDDSVNDKTYKPPIEPCSRNILADDSGSELDVIIPCSQVLLERTVSSSDESIESFPNEILTKRGTIRQRKTYNVHYKERKKIRREEKVLNKYFVKPGCLENVCKKKCSTRFSEEYREMLNRNFWRLSWQEQKHFFLANSLQKKPTKPKDKTKDDPKGKHYVRSKSVFYFLVDENGDKTSVCKTFFLTTLGYKKSNCKAIRNILSSSQTHYAESIIDRRGKKSIKRIDITKVKEHIMSFRPAVSHYRRVHAPNRLYLPSDLTVQSMYNNYCETEPEIKVSYSYYRDVVKKLNISFAKLGQEQCELCQKFNIHNPNSEIRHRNCQECKDYEEHYIRYVSARIKYEEDANNQSNNSSHESIIFAVDLEKVIMIPRMEEFKVVMFCPRVIVFNQSFVPIGQKTKHQIGKTLAVLWNEAVSGRKKDDIISCFRVFFLENRDCKHITLWLDNCAAQNKNWALFSYLVYVVNSDDFNFESIKLRYLEVGHTFMAADEFHHRVELSLKREKRVYDFADFCNAVSKTGPQTITKKMDYQDFYEFEDCSSNAKLKKSNPRAYMKNISEASFRRGFKTLLYKTSHSSELEIELDFLKIKSNRSGIPPPRQKSACRGITSERKSAILTKLGPLMPANRRLFWENLPVNDSSTDLTVSYED